MKQKISLAYSPDTDDAFMIEAIKCGAIETGDYEFDLITGDIQLLNEEARKGSFDVTAISIAAWPSIADQYQMIPVGASIGDGYGPAVIVKKTSDICTIEDLQGLRVAVPGRDTSAYWAALGLIGDFTPRQAAFTEIEGLVLSGQVEAGILIHEPQIDCHEDLRSIGNLGKLWHDRWQLPLPLGTNAIRRSLDDQVISDVVGIMKASVQYGLDNRQEVLAKATGVARPDFDMKLADRYIDMYVNHRSLSMAPDVCAAIETLYDIGSRHGLCDPETIALENWRPHLQCEVQN